MSARAQKSNYPGDIPPLEWAVAGLGLLLLVGFLFLIVHHELAGPKGPPDIEVKVGDVQSMRTGYLVRFDVINHGGLTASALMLKGELSRNDEPLEISDAVIDHLPAGSRRSGGMWFRHDPRKAHLELRAASFQEP